MKSIETKIFGAGHPPVAYYVSALALYRLESLLRKKVIDAKYRPFKYHLLAVIRMQLAGVAIPLMSSNKFEKYCDGIVKSLQDEKTFGEIVPKALTILDTVLKGSYGRDKAKDVSLIAAAEAFCKA